MQAGGLDSAPGVEDSAWCLSRCVSDSTVVALAVLRSPSLISRAQARAEAEALGNVNAFDLKSCHSVYGALQVRRNHDGPAHAALRR